jgi:hypothetical protein
MAEIESKLFDAIRHLLPEGSNILELGSGAGSAKLAKCFNITCVEHNTDYLDKYDNIEYVYAPISYCKPTVYLQDQDQWYDKEIMKKVLQEVQYDLILIDGPPGNIGRGGILRYKDYIRADVPIFIDDTNREAEWKLAVTFSRSNRWSIWTPYPENRTMYSVVAEDSTLRRLTEYEFSTLPDN